MAHDMSRLACRICVVTKGITVRDTFATEDDLLTHIESEHHMPVRRKGESEEDCTKRFVASHPNAATCEGCKKRGAPWTREQPPEVM